MRLFSQISVRVLIFGNFEFSNLFSHIRLKKRHTSFFSGNRREIRTKLVSEFQNRLLQNRYRTYSTWWRTRWGATSGASLGFPRMDFPARFLQMFRNCQTEWLPLPFSFDEFISCSTCFKFARDCALWNLSSSSFSPAPSDMIHLERYGVSLWKQAAAKIDGPRYAIQRCQEKHRDINSYASWANRHIVDWQNLRY